MAVGSQPQHWSNFTVFQENDSLDSKLSKLLEFTSSMIVKQQGEDAKWSEDLHGLRAEYMQKFEQQTQQLKECREELEKAKEANTLLQEELSLNLKDHQSSKSLEFLCEMSGVSLPDLECRKGARQGAGQEITEPHVFVMTKGEYQGLTFSLTCSPVQEEYSYHPMEGSKELPADSDFKYSFCFPRPMLSLFFCKLLRSHYSSQNPAHSPQDPPTDPVM